MTNFLKTVTRKYQTAVTAKKGLKFYILDFEKKLVFGPGSDNLDQTKDRAARSSSGVVITSDELPKVLKWAKMAGEK